MFHRVPNWVAAPGSTSRAAADSRKEPALAGTTQIQRDEHTLCSMSEGSLWSESRAAGAKPEWCCCRLDAGGQLCFWRLLWLYRRAAHRLALTSSKNSVWWPWCVKTKLCLKSTVSELNLHLCAYICGAGRSASSWFLCCSYPLQDILCNTFVWKDP